MSLPRLRSVGNCALLMEMDSLAEVMGMQSLLLQQHPTGVIDVVAAARTVLIRCDSPASLQSLWLLLGSARPAQLDPVQGTQHIFNTVYDGADLTEASRLTGLSVEALITWHSGQDWVAAFGGFAPGFMYLTPTDRSLNVPRRRTPRTAVPAGSLAVGGEFSAVYPGPTPGGWQLLGRCAESLWDTQRTQAPLLQPGDRIQFQPARELVRLGPREQSHAQVPHARERFGLEVLAPGVSATVQDLGRPGNAHVGVSASGALDRPALRRANRMVGNLPTSGPGAAGLELVLAGLSVQAHGTQVLAVASNSVQLTICNRSGTQRQAPVDTAIALQDGEVLTVHAAPDATGFRSVLAVRGGIDMKPVLGSQSTDMLSGLGPKPLCVGDFLPVSQTAPVGVVGFPEPSAPGNTLGPVLLRFTTGPRSDWFTPASLAAFEQRVWRVGVQSNRVGLRLELQDSQAGAGTPLQRTAAARYRELPSEGMVDGAIQVPPSGLPVLFLADHPVTGGYPVVGVVPAADLSRAAALAPGAAVQFRRCAEKSTAAPG